MAMHSESEYVRRARVAGLEMLARFERIEATTAAPDFRSPLRPAKPKYTGPERRSPFSAAARAQIARVH